MSSSLFSGFLAGILSAPAPKPEESLKMIEAIARRASKREGHWVHNEALAQILTICEELRRE